MVKPLLIYYPRNEWNRFLIPTTKNKKLPKSKLLPQQKNIPTTHTLRKLTPKMTRYSRILHLQAPKAANFAHQVTWLGLDITKVTLKAAAATWHLCLKKGGRFQIHFAIFVGRNCLRIFVGKKSLTSLGRTKVRFMDLRISLVRRSKKNCRHLPSTTRLHLNMGGWSILRSRDCWESSWPVSASRGIMKYFSSYRMEYEDLRIDRKHFLVAYGKTDHSSWETIQWVS